MIGRRNRRSQGVVAYICATLFAIFSFLFIVAYQSPLLEAFYDKVATGKLDYNRYVAGLFMTGILLLVAMGLNRFARFRREWTALAYLPSTLLLAFFTDIDRSMYVGGWSCWGWIGIFILGFAIYFALAYVLKRLRSINTSNSIAHNPLRIIWRNLIIFVILFLIAGTLSNGDENFKREALAVSYCKSGDYGKALEVGYKSLDASQELTAIRSYALAMNSDMGERLFEYPQLYASEGLLPRLVQTSPLVPDTVFAFIGDRPVANETAAEFLDRIAHKDSVSPAVREMYLSSLLLNRNLYIFEKEIRCLYDSIPAYELPKHFREALVLYSSLDSCYTLELRSDTLFQQFDSLKAIEARYADPIVRNNYVRKDFGRTYWWYFLYGK